MARPEGATIKVVVSALILQAREPSAQGKNATTRVLLTQRRPDQDYAWHWETPGGKVEPGETHLRALRRELWEEIGVRHVELVTTPVGDVDWPAGVVHTARVARHRRPPVVVHLYPVRCPERPSPREGQGIGWFSADELPRLTLCPANRQGLDEILRRMEAYRG